METKAKATFVLSAHSWERHGEMKAPVHEET